MSARNMSAEPIAADPISAAQQAPAVMPVYARQPVVFERGEGSWLVSAAGERYLDFGSGVAVCSLGHAHPHLVAALTRQAAKLWHTSNLYRVAEQERLAERLAALTFADVAFFCNSGAEACEAAIKAARRHHDVNGHPERWRVLTFEGAFHGRTLATLAAGGNPKHLAGFDPPVDGFDQVPLNDIEAALAAIGPETAAIMIEPVQGEGGVRVASLAFLRSLREICDARGLLFILDEIQCGMGRTGALFAHEWAGVEPDLMAIAKGLGGGFPVGGLLATAEAAKGMTAGTHGSTFGGNPLAMAVANAVLDVVTEPEFLTTVRRRASQLKEGLDELARAFPDVVEEVRGHGLLMGLKLRTPLAASIDAITARRLLVVGAAENVIRILPPLNVREDEVADALDRLSLAFGTPRGRGA